MDPPEAAQLRVEVVYALPERQWLVALSLPLSATVREAVVASGLLQRLPDIDLDELTLGVFGTVVAHDQALRDGDRVEIYRPLKIDPREARRILARQRRTMRDGLD